MSDAITSLSGWRARLLWLAVLAAATGCHVTHPRQTLRPSSVTLPRDMCGSQFDQAPATADAPSPDSLPPASPDSEPAIPDSSAAAETGHSASAAELPQELNADQARATLEQLGGRLQSHVDGGIIEADLSFSRISDEELPLITLFPGLRELDLTGTDVHDDSMRWIATLPELQALKLKGTRITSDGLVTLTQIDSLILLDVSSTGISDEALAHASAWSRLRYLSLNNTKISDAGLRHLQSLKSLKGLSLINTAVTGAGLQQLKEALPECLVVAERDTAANVQQEDPAADSSGSTVFTSSTAGLNSGDELEQVIDLAARQPHLAVCLAEVYSDRGQWEEASRILAAAAVADFSDVALQFRLGEALARTGRTEAARAHFAQAVGDAAAAYNVGLIEYEHMLQQCERRFSEALEMDPTLTPARARLQDVQNRLAQLGRETQTVPAPVMVEQEQEPPQVIPAPVIRPASRSRSSPTD